MTVDSVIARLKASKGSFYYRFASRDALLGELWLATVLSYQRGFVAAIDAGDGLAAALHTPGRGHACIWMMPACCCSSAATKTGQGDWPATLKRGVADQAQRFEVCLKGFARQAFGGAGPGTAPARTTSC